MYSQQTHVYKVASGCDIHAEVYRSPDQEVRPVIFFLHGGALIIGNRFNMPPAGPARRSQGRSPPPPGA